MTQRSVYSTPPGDGKPKLRNHVLTSLGLKPSDQPLLSGRWRPHPRCSESLLDVTRCQSLGRCQTKNETQSLSGSDSCACFSVGNETNQFLAPAFCFPGKMGKAKIILYVLNCFYLGGGWKGLMLIEDISGLRDIPHLPVRTQCCWHRAVVSWSPVLVLNTV